MQIPLSLALSFYSLRKLLAYGWYENGGGAKYNLDFFQWLFCAKGFFLTANWNDILLITESWCTVLVFDTKTPAQVLCRLSFITKKNTGNYIFIFIRLPDKNISWGYLDKLLLVTSATKFFYFYLRVSCFVFYDFLIFFCLIKRQTATMQVEL